MSNSGLKKTKKNSGLYKPERNEISSFTYLKTTKKDILKKNKAVILGKTVQCLFACVTIVNILLSFQYCKNYCNSDAAECSSMFMRQ